MKDRIAGAPGQYSAVVAGGEYQKLQTGQPFSITLTRDDKPEVEGTPYSKAAVLPDDVAKRLCPDLEDPSPADAFDSLSKGTMPTITANPDTLQEVISSARPGTTIQLMASDEEYPLLTLKGKNAFPENLTILGGEGVTIEGISITSGVNEADWFWDCDNSNAVLPKGLTLKDLTVSRGVSLRNAVVDNLSVINCHITSGSICIAPNRYKDQFGSDEHTQTNEQHRSNIALPPVKNLLIRDCVIDDASHATIGWLKSAIYVQCVNNATIENNTINRAEFNGIQVTNSSGSATTGKIAISGNTINYSGSRSIRVSNLRDANLWVVSNKLFNANKLEKNDEYIKVSGCEYTSYFWNMEKSDTHHTHNRHEGIVISVGNGISVQSAKEDYVVAQGTSGIWTYRKWASGMAECWLRIEAEVDGGDGIPSLVFPNGGAFNVVDNIEYPFPFIDIPNVVSQIQVGSSPALPVLSYDNYMLYILALSPSTGTRFTETSVYVFGRYK